MQPASFSEKPRVLRFLNTTWPAVEKKIVRQFNKDTILDLVRWAPEGISRAEIAQRLGVSRSTVSAVVDGLIASGLVFERGAGVSRGGRRPIVLEINPDAGRVVGVDIGATHLVVVVADLRGRVLAETETRADIARGTEVTLHEVFTQVDAALRSADCRFGEIDAIGVGVPGPVIAARGVVSSPPIMPGWDDFPIRQRLAEHWRKPVTLDNDADLGALGEWTFGAGRMEKSLVYIKVGTGIGCGILLDGQIYHGVLGTAGEIGHVTISEDGPPCTCGNYGCLEAMAGGRAIAQRAQLAVKAGQRTLLARKPFDGITARDVAEAASSGDAVSQQLLSDAGRHIGSALASLINLLNPGLVLIGGGVAEAGVYLLDPIHEAVRQRSLRASLQATRIEVAALGRRATPLGAVSLAITETFRRHITRV
jgi:glucokinase-like ROK family protein